MLALVMLVLAQSPALKPPPLLKRPEERVYQPTPYLFVSWEKGGVPEQLSAPCPNLAVIWTVEGKCWGKTTDKTPCPTETWEHEASCYVPVVKDDRVPAS